MYINSIRLINFLEEHGYFPEYENGNTIYFAKSNKLSELLQKYSIYYCF